jgi:hypothetical protein
MAASCRIIPKFTSPGRRCNSLIKLLHGTESFLRRNRVSGQVKKFHAFYGTQKLHCHIKNRMSKNSPSKMKFFLLRNAPNSYAMRTLFTFHLIHDTCVRHLLFSTASRLALRYSQSQAWSSKSTPPYVFMAWSLK